MIDTGDLRKGVTFTLDGRLVKVLDYAHNKQGRGSAQVKMTLRDLRTGATTQHTVQSGAKFAQVRLERQHVQFLYSDPDGFHFMDSADFNQFSFPVDDLSDQAPYMTENMEGIEALVVDDEVIAIELPDTVEMTIVETAPGVRGNSATGRTKPATLATGHIVQVPEHLDQGVVVRVDTRTGEYLGRAN